MAKTFQFELAVVPAPPASLHSADRVLFLATAASAQSLQERMLQAEDARPTTEAGLAPLLEGLQGNGRRTAIRAIGRLERPEMIALIAPALNDGVGIRAEAANALAQMARTPAAVVEVQKLLLARAAMDASLNTWESWGEIAAALGRLPYDTTEQVAGDRSRAVDRTAGAGFVERRRDRGARRIGARIRIAGAHGAREEAAAARRAHLGSAAMGRDRTAARRRSAIGADPPAGDGGARHRQPGDHVGDRARAERRRRGSAAFCRRRRGDRRAHRRARSRDQDRPRRQGTARPPRSAARVGPPLSEDVVRADSCSR